MNRQLLLVLTACLFGSSTPMLSQSPNPVSGIWSVLGRGGKKTVSYFFDGYSVCSPKRAALIAPAGLLCRAGFTNNLFSRSVAAIGAQYFILRNAPGLIAGAMQASSGAPIEECLFGGIPLSLLVATLFDEKFAADYGISINWPTRVMYTLGSYATGYVVVYILKKLFEEKPANELSPAKLQHVTFNNKRMYNNRRVR